MNTLSEKSVLMKFSAGCPGSARKDKTTTELVKVEKALGHNAGKWVAELYPPDAMKPIKQLQNEARTFHDTMTLPFGGGDGEDGKPRAIAGTGILPCGLVLDYTSKIREFQSKLTALVDKFLADPQGYVGWALQEHNGTFNPDNYPGCTRDDAGQIQFDADKFRQVMRPKFYLSAEPLPVPDVSHFSATVSSLLGTDIESVNLRVSDAQVEARRELMRRLIAPVKNMVQRLADGEKFKDSLVGNVAEIVKLAPALNLSGDPEIDQFIADLKPLAQADPDALRNDKTVRSQTRDAAGAMLKRLSGYKI